MKAEVGDDVKIVTSPTDDLRSYHVSSEKIRRELGWQPRYTVPDAIRELIGGVQGRARCRTRLPIRATSTSRP